MLLLQGIVANTFTAPTGVSKKTGEEYGGQEKVQIMAEKHLQNGETALELLSLTVEDAAEYTQHKGMTVRVPVGVFSTPKGLAYYVPKGSFPEPV
ncbi:MAG: hypothetical protein EOM12_14865 [Verrucomicrobiae bacterium]|nr:hypothetical protein [Verrucomicrobiae bacterium]